MHVAKWEEKVFDGYISFDCNDIALWEMQNLTQTLLVGSLLINEEIKEFGELAPGTGGYIPA